MDIARVSTATEAPSATAAAQSKTKLDADYQNFLKLLIAQVSNQDPLEPMDSTTFVSQLAQLTQVEQTITTNTNLEKIDKRLGNVTALADVQLIGRDVTVPTDRIELRDGKGTLSYTLAGEAAAVSVVIRASDGAVLRELTGQPGTAGVPHSVEWDGLDSQGLPAASSAFVVSVNATDAAGNAVSSQTTSASRVEQLTFRDGLPVLVLRNGSEAFPGSVTAVQ